MQLALEAKVYPGQEAVFERNSNVDFRPEFFYVYVKEEGDRDFVIPLHGAHSRMGPRAGMLSLLEARVGDGPLLEAAIPSGGLMLMLFEPNGVGAQTGLAHVLMGDPVRFVVRSDRSQPVELRLVLTDELGVPEAESFPPLSPAWAPVAPVGPSLRAGQMSEVIGRGGPPLERELIAGIDSVGFRPGEEKEVFFRGHPMAFRPRKLIIPEAIGLAFDGILDFRVSGESRLVGGRLAEPQSCLTFAEWTTVPYFNVGAVTADDKVSMVVRAGPSGGTFTAAMIGPVTE